MFFQGNGAYFAECSSKADESHDLWLDLETKRQAQLYWEVFRWCFLWDVKSTNPNVTGKYDASTLRYSSAGEGIYEGVYAMLLCRVACGQMLRMLRPDSQMVEQTIGKVASAVLGDREARKPWKSNLEWILCMMMHDVFPHVPQVSPSLYTKNCNY